MKNSAEQRGLKTLLSDFFCQRPGRGLTMVGCLLVSGVMEIISIAILLPLLHMISGQRSGDDSWLSNRVTEVFNFFGLPMTIGVMMSVILGGLVLKAVINSGGLVLAAYGYADYAAEIRVRLLQNLLRADWTFFTSKPAGSFGNALGIEAHNAAGLYLQIARMLAAVLQVPFYIVVAIAISWRMTALAIVASVVIIVALSWLIGLARRAGQRQASLYNEIISRISDLLASIKVLKAMALDEAVRPMLERNSQALSQALRLQAIVGILNRGMQEPLTSLFLMLGLYFGISNGGLTLSELLVLGFAFHRCVNQLTVLQSQYQAIAGNEAFYFSMLGKISESAAAVEQFHGVDKIALNQSVELRKITKGFGDNQVLNDVDITIPAGAITVLIGPSGSGKTTLIDMVLGLYRPDSGYIKIDGRLLAEVDVRSWRRDVGYVPQDTVLLNDTIEHNITLGDPDLSEDDVWNALERAEAKPFVVALSAGLKANVGERGAKLSGGQRQRIAIARALVRRPNLLILDEATASLDPSTEEGICRTLKQLVGSVTILAVTHRPALLGIADQVYEVCEGRASLRRTVSASADAR